MTNDDFRGNKNFRGNPNLKKCQTRFVSVTSGTSRDENTKVRGRLFVETWDEVSYPSLLYEENKFNEGTKYLSRDCSPLVKIRRTRRTGRTLSIECSLDPTPTIPKSQGPEDKETTPKGRDLLRTYLLLSGQEEQVGTDLISNTFCFVPTSYSLLP